MSNTGEDDSTSAEAAAVEHLVAAMKAMGEMMQDMTARVVGIHQQANAHMRRLMLRHPDLAYLDAQLDGYYS